MTSSTRRSCAARLVALLLGCLQLFGAGAVPLADAQVERAAIGAVTHAEAPDAKGCPAAHDHGKCVLCRHIEHATPELLPTAAPVPPRLARREPPGEDMR
ncbi:MAG TPA: hypothetical protein VEZ47_00450, partial [Gemmatirosa sp.]|nr:hypothetical protein [Gemmatirosa sp.]